MVRVSVRLYPNPQTAPAEGLLVLKMRSSFLCAPCCKLTEERRGYLVLQIEGVGQWEVREQELPPMKVEGLCSRNASPQTSSKCWGERLGLPEGH